MVKTYGKSVIRMFKSNVVRILAISFIIAIGISIVTGIGAVAVKMQDAVAITLESEQTIMALEIANKVELISNIIPLFFIIIAALTALTTMTRLVEEERPAIACLRSIGYSKKAIIFKYILFALVCAVLGCSLGLIIGNYAILPVIYNGVTARFVLEEPASSFFVKYGFIWSVVMSTAVVATALIISGLKCREKPASLFRAKTPKAGKKILLEYMPLIWKPLKFKYKSSLRNIFRDKGRLIMTGLAVTGSTMMLFCGLGLFTSLDGISTDIVYGGGAFVDSLEPIALAIVFFAIALSILVLFNLTNINIEERKREIATLKVLGYRQVEVAGYIYREVMILSALGILLGTPFGYLLLGFIFDYIDFGSLDYVNWYVWVIVPITALLCVFVTDFLLYRKINKIDMSTSLKTID